MPIESPAKPPQFVAVKSIVLQGIRGLGEPRVVARREQEEGEWSGYPDPTDPDNFWIDDKSGERIDARTGERHPQ